MSYLDTYKDEMVALHSELNSDRFSKAKVTGSSIVYSNMSRSIINLFTDNEVLNSKDRELLYSVFDTDEIDISRGQKVKIRNILIKKIKPVLDEYIDTIEKDKPIELNLPTVNEVLKEIRKDSKPAIRITGGPVKKDTKQKETKEVSTEDKETAKVGEVKVTEDKATEDKATMVEQIFETVNSQTVSHKELLTDDQKTIIRQLRNKLYSKDKIEIFPNQALKSFVQGDVLMGNYLVDLLVCDKETFNIICAVSIVDKVEIDFGAAILNKLNIKRFVIKRVNGILDSQDIRALEEEINNRYAPMCKMCGLPMIQKENIKTRHRFYACMDNQNCRFTIDMGD